MRYNDQGQLIAVYGPHKGEPIPTPKPSMRARVAAAWESYVSHGGQF